MKLRETLSSAVVVVFMTLIVWIAADRAVLRTSPEMVVPIEVSAPSVNYRVTVTDPDPPRLHVKFHGPGHAIDGLSQGQPQVAFRYTLTAEDARRAVTSGQLTLSAKQGFEELTRLYGISSEPLGASTVTIKVEAVEQVKAQVDLSPTDHRLVAEGATIKPNVVLAMVPSSALARIKDTPLVAVPQLNLETSELLAGHEAAQVAALKPNIPGLTVTFVPAQAEVTLRLLMPLEKRTLSNIKIRVEGPPEVFARYDVVLVEPAINNLKIVGPKTEVAALAPEEVRAVLTLLSDDKPNEGSFKIRKLEIRFPEGSHMRLDDDTPAPTVTFNLKERVAAETAKEPKAP